MGRSSSAVPRSDSGKVETDPSSPTPNAASLKPRPAPKREPVDDSEGTERTGEMRRDRGGDWEFRGRARLASAKSAGSVCVCDANSASCPRLQITDAPQRQDNSQRREGGLELWGYVPSRKSSRVPLKKLPAMAARVGLRCFGAGSRLHALHRWLSRRGGVSERR